MMKLSHQVLAGVAIIGFGIGCSELNKPIPDTTAKKCEVCHTSIPPQDSGTVTGRDSLLIGIHHTHVMTEALMCDACHFGYDKESGTWNLPANHFSDSISYDSSRCVQCHKYSNCNNALCHSSPPNSTPENKKIHDFHAMKISDKGDTTGYNCGFCHKGYDFENLSTPLNLPTDLHDNGTVDVIFDLPFSNNPLSMPNYNSLTGSCEFTYCHGTTITGGKNSVSIYDPIDTVGSAECNFCHDTLRLAFDIPDHARSQHSEYFKDCINCHAGYMLKGSVINKENHINGSTSSIDTDCSSCHPGLVPVF